MKRSPKTARPDLPGTGQHILAMICEEQIHHGTLVSNRFRVSLDSIPGTAGGRKATLASILRKSRPGVRLNEHLEHPEGEVVFQHACKMGLEGIVSKRLGSRYRSGRSPDWLKFKNPEAPAVRREAEEDWGR